MLTSILAGVGVVIGICVLLFIPAYMVSDAVNNL